MSLAVDEPILNNPFEEPEGHRVYEKGQSKRMSGRFREESNNRRIKITEIKKIGVNI